MDSVSPSMCLAKWTQSTIYLNTGHTHSCHHPGVHPIPVEGLAENPGMIHNTPHKQNMRQLMLDGVRPKECDYCWRIEDLPGEHNSDRIHKSAASWSFPDFDRVLESGTGADFAPRYVEVLFETTCNFACSYCLPAVSSKISDEIERLGPYQLSNKQLHVIQDARKSGRVDPENGNEYTTAFWKIIPEWWKTLHTFRITGGEPLLSKHTWSMLDFVENNANKDMDFAINSNLGVPDKLISQLIKRVNEISPNLDRFTVFTSVEATGKQAEYIRYGMEYERFISNLMRVLVETNATVGIMTTINALSYSTFMDFIDTMIELRKTYGRRILLSFNYVRYPECLDVQFLPTELKEPWAERMRALVNKGSTMEEFSATLYTHEIEQLQRFCDYLVSEPSIEAKQQQQLDLAMYTKQLDERRKLDFPNTFPELAALLPKV